MKQEWLIKYEAMLRDMESCAEQWTGDQKGRIECCFNMGQRHWGQIQNQIEELQFDSRAEEIEFYKRVKPMFRSPIEYYNLLYQAELFKPAEDSGELTEFWIRETQKLDRFTQDNPEFYAYYKSGATDRDEEYFLMPAAEGDKARTVYMDDLIVTLLALEKYNEFVTGQLDSLYRQTEMDPTRRSHIYPALLFLCFCASVTFYFFGGRDREESLSVLVWIITELFLLAVTLVLLLLRITGIKKKTGGLGYYLLGTLHLFLLGIDGVLFAGIAEINPVAVSAFGVFNGLLGAAIFIDIYRKKTADRK